MSDVNVLDEAGKKVGTVKVAEEFLKPEVSKQVVADAVTAYRAGQRRGTASTKTKSEVNFSGAKPWKQKGTGRARSGEKASPIWRKGSVVFGPRPRSYRKTLNKKVAKAAFHVAIADKLANDALVLVENFVLEKPKTKLLAALLGKWKVDSERRGGALLLLEKADKNVELAARNIPGVEVQPARTVTTYDVLRFKKIIATKAAFDQLKNRSTLSAEESKGESK